MADEIAANLEQAQRIVACPSCGEENRVLDRFSLDARPTASGMTHDPVRCVKCGAELPGPPPQPDAANP